jgi:hypothetical protein
MLPAKLNFTNGTRLAGLAYDTAVATDPIDKAITGISLFLQFFPWFHLDRLEDDQQLKVKLDALALDSAITVDRLSEYMILYRDMKARYFRAESKCSELERSKSLEQAKLLEELSELQAARERHEIEAKGLRAEIELLKVKTSVSMNTNYLNVTQIVKSTSELGTEGQKCLHQDTQSISGEFKACIILIFDLCMRADALPPARISFARRDDESEIRHTRSPSHPEWHATRCSEAGGNTRAFHLAWILAWECVRCKYNLLLEHSKIASSLYAIKIPVSQKRVR